MSALTALSRRLANVVRRARDSGSYVRKWLHTPRSERVGLQPPRLLKTPVCWFRGCDYGSSICIEPWSLQFCSCCGQEVGFRTSWNSIRARTPEEDEEYGYAWGHDR